jgi:CHAT domain-containing protein
LLLRGEATEASLKQLHGPRILHLARHGFFLDDQDTRRMVLRSAALEDPMLRAGLALAGANARRSGFGEDGILTALEAAQLDLRGTKSDVLSACETGVGEVRNGFGVVGLRRGLLLAGAQSLVTSLWNVGDLATQELMVSFYENLTSARGPARGRSAALRAAQLRMLAKPGYAHPYYWAAFLNTGDWTALPRDANLAKKE